MCCTVALYSTHCTKCTVCITYIAFPFLRVDQSLGTTASWMKDTSLRIQRQRWALCMYMHACTDREGERDGEWMEGGREDRVCSIHAIIPLLVPSNFVYPTTPRLQRLLKN